jgi:hypothetical protein
MITSVVSIHWPAGSRVMEFFFASSNAMVARALNTTAPVRTSRTDPSETGGAARTAACQRANCLSIRYCLL